MMKRQTQCVVICINTIPIARFDWLKVMGVVPDCVCGCEHADLMPQTALSSQDHAMGGVMIKMPKNG